MRAMSAAGSRAPILTLKVPVQPGGELALGLLDLLRRVTGG